MKLHQRPAPPVAPDAEGSDLEPDPTRAATLLEPHWALVEFWRWVGRPSSRSIAAANPPKTISHGTVNRLLRGDGVPLTLARVRAVVHGCGGGVERVQRWVAAYRVLDGARRI